MERAAQQIRGLPREESHQIAAVALFRALEGFNDAHRVPFAAYAAYWFRKESQLGRASTIYRTALPAHRVSALGRGQSAADTTLRDMAAASTIDPDAPIAALGPSPEEATVEALTYSEIRRDVARLEPLSRRIVELRFGFDGDHPRSNRAVAALVGVSEFTVRRHLTRAFRVLRTRLARLDEAAAPTP